MKERTDEFVITDISWERIFLNLKITGKTGAQFVFKSKKSKNIIPIKAKEIDKGNYNLSINIVAVKDRSFLENGIWYIGTIENDEFKHCLITEEVAFKLENLDKIYKYGGIKYAYLVSFNVFTKDDISMHLEICSIFMMENRNWKKRKVLGPPKNLKSLTHIKVVSALNIIKLAIIRKIINVIYQILTHLYPKKGKNILLVSETNTSISGNLLALDKRIKERQLDKEFNLYYSVRHSVGKSNSFFSWLKVIKNIAKADYIFVDNFAPIFGQIEIDKRVEFIQLWHAGGGFKAVGYCRFGKEGSPLPLQSCHKKYTKALTGSTSLIKVFAEVFGIEEEAFLPVGMPRLDNFLEPKIIKDFKDKFYNENPNLKNKKIILFCPTYRGVGQKTAFYDFTKLDFDRIYEFCKNEYIFMIKLHPFISQKPPIEEEYKERIVDFSDYPNINELYYITDIMITDYSSSFYEFSLMEKPILFYTYDRCIYETTRGVYRSVKESAPGKVCDSFDELMKALENKDYEYEKVLEFVKENFDEYDSKATDKAIDAILFKK